MTSKWMRQVTGEERGSALAIEQMRHLKQSLIQAPNNRDWSLVTRIDRLNSQLVDSLNPDDRDTAADIIRELLEYKALYRQSILIIEKALSEHSNQAF